MSYTHRMFADMQYIHVHEKDVVTFDRSWTTFHATILTGTKLQTPNDKICFV